MIGQGVFGHFKTHNWGIRIFIILFCIFLLLLNILMLNYEAEGPIALIIKLIG
jgi:hypothetical protein